MSKKLVIFGLDEDDISKIKNILMLEGILQATEFQFYVEDDD